MAFGIPFILDLSDGVSQDGFGSLLQRLQAKKLIKVDFTWIDSTSIMVHRHDSGALKKKEIK